LLKKSKEEGVLDRKRNVSLLLKERKGGNRRDHTVLLMGRLRRGFDSRLISASGLGQEKLLNARKRKEGMISHSEHLVGRGRLEAVH